MIEIELAYEGNLRVASRHGPSGAELHTDAPVDNRGKGESFSPTDLLATALGSCMTTIMGIRAQDEGWTLEGLAVRVEKHMVADPHRRVGKLVVEVQWPEGLAPDAQRALEAAARGCPVCRSLASAVELDLRFG